MKISIVTVCYNSEKTIRSTIESVLSQDYPNVEHIIIDGCSTDNTLSIVKEYQNNLALIISEPDLGIYDAMNKGISAATGDVVGILNSDDYYQNPMVLSIVANSFNNDESIDVVFGDVVFVRPDNFDKIVRFYNSSHFSPWKLRFGWMPPHPGTFAKRSVYEKYGDYSLNFKIAADYEIFVRWLLVHRLKYKYLNEVIVRMRTGGISTSGLRSSMILNKEIVAACKTNGIYTNILFILSKVPFKLLEIISKPKNDNG